MAAKMHIAAQATAVSLCVHSSMHIASLHPLSWFCRVCMTLSLALCMAVSWALCTAGAMSRAIWPSLLECCMAMPAM